MILENFDDASLDIIFTYGGSGGDWTLDSTFALSGTQSLRSADIANGENTTASFDVVVPSGEQRILEIWNKPDSEASDRFHLSVDASELFSRGGTGQPWEGTLILLDPGTHTIELKFTKDSSISSGSDSVFIDHIRISGPDEVDGGGGGGGGGVTEGQVWPRVGPGTEGPAGAAGGDGPDGPVGPPGMSASRYRARASVVGGSRSSGLPGSDISFDTEDFDNDSIFSGGSPTELIAQHDGIYRFGCNVQTDATAGGIRRLTATHHLTGGGTEDVAYDSRDQQGAGVGLEAESVIEMVAGEYVTFKLGQDSGSTITFTAHAYLAGGTP